MGRTVYSKSRQTGKTHLVKDRMFEALSPGKRISSSGKIYYEYRKNRSDISLSKRV